MSFLRRCKPLIISILVLACFLASLPFHTDFSYAAFPKLDRIRVSLFIDQRGTVPSVTLSSPKSLQIGVRLPEGIHSLLSAGANKSVRISIDQYRVKLLEAQSYTAAKNLYNQLEDSGFQPYLFKVSRKGAIVYQVYIGNFATSEGAGKAAATAAGIAGYASGAPVVAGPLHWIAGTYATEAEARDRTNGLSLKGIDAYSVYQQNSQGKTVYSVWIGEASTTAQLNEIKTLALKASPDLQLVKPDTNLPYLLRREDASFGSSDSAIPHLYFNANGEKVWASSASPGIHVQERYRRDYRGSIEVSQYNGKLAVINELPFEQYLYSVVGSEMGSGWPLEALKAQAVVARTYALTLGLKYKIAHISDTTYDQAYFGMGVEFADSITAVDQTKAEVVVNKDGLITPFYYSNSGGLTADASEVWGSPLTFIKSVPSPDQDVQDKKLPWYRIVLPDGKVGYIRSDFVKITGQLNPAGLPILEAQDMGINVRPAPYVDNNSNGPIAQVNIGDRFVAFDKVPESNSFSWIRGPFTAEDMLVSINANSSAMSITKPLQTLNVTQRGPSGRVMDMQANGQEIKVSRPDSYRTVMNGLPSTRFDVEETGRYTVLGANGTKRSFPQSKGMLYAASGTSAVNPRPEQNASQLSGDELFLMNENSNVRLATQQPEFRFVGLGYGHGLGMSQWGARALAELQYDYKYILQYYYKDVSIVKE